MTSRNRWNPWEKTQPLEGHHFPSLEPHRNLGVPCFSHQEITFETNTRFERTPLSLTCWFFPRQSIRYIIVSQILGLVQPLFIFLNSAGFLPYFIWWFEIPTLVEFRGFFWLKSPELVRDFTIILHINSTRTAPWSWTERARRSGLRPPMKKSWSIRSWKREPKMAVCICGSYIYMKNIELGWISKSRDYFQEANGATSPINIFGTNLRTDGRTI